MAKNSEIFDNYIQIALQKGMVKTAAPEKKVAKTEVMNQTNPRFDSLSVEDIAKLYDVKNDKPEGMEYKRNIVENAHPEPVIFFNSHDKVNSLVENVNERQDIIINIMRKMPNGNIAYKKYAEAELATALIRTAIEMDNLKQDEFRILADVCTRQLKKKSQDAATAPAAPANKPGKGFMNSLENAGEDAADVAGGAGAGALIFGTVGGLIGALGGPFGVWAGIQGGAMAGAALSGIASAIWKTSPQAKNVAINAQLARDQLSDIIKDRPKDTFLIKLDGALAHIIQSASQYSQVVDKMHENDQSQESKQEAHNVGTIYKSELQALSKDMEIFLTNAKSGEYAPQESAWWSKVKSPFVSIFGDEVGDEVKALDVLKTVIAAAEQGINDVEVQVGAGVKATQQAQQYPQAVQPTPQAVQPTPQQAAPTTYQRVNWTPEKQQKYLADLAKIQAPTEEADTE